MQDTSHATTSETLPHYFGMGDWKYFSIPLSHIESAASHWRVALGSIDKPWLCWHINERWTKVQVKLVREVGWTPVVGWDSQYDPPSEKLDAVLINFKNNLNCELMWFHFPLEFSHLWAPRLAFWHSDLLCRLSTMKSLAEQFSSISAGAMAAVKDKGGRRHFFNRNRHRYWELVGCTTSAASKDQFKNGAGWWRNIAFHPNYGNETEKNKRMKIPYDHGYGIMYWKRFYDGKVLNLDRRRIEEGHATSINFRDYKRTAHVNRKDLGNEIDLNYSLEKLCEQLGITKFL